MPMTWNDKADVRLFVNVLKIHKVKLDYDALATAMGPGCTAKAIMHRVTKLRSIAAEEEKGGAGAAANGTNTQTGGNKTTRANNNNKANGATKGKKGGGKRKAKDVEAERDDDHVDGDLKIESNLDDGEPQGKRFKAEGVLEEDSDEVVQDGQDDED